MRTGKQIVESRQLLKAEEVYPAVLYLAKQQKSEEDVVAFIKELRAENYENIS